ncbi:MAG: threonylcarbamoyl-AMP synthase [Thermoprotei archaeon]|nr:MAG: threonylcarbamoyl-AMP synthase [Thermoprotei archaeon]
MITIPQVIRITTEEDLQEKLKIAVETVKKGGLVVFPTDTVYGLGATPFSDKAVERILKVKKRPPGKHIPLLASSIEKVMEIAVFNKYSLTLARKFWPGPLTLVLPLRDRTPISPLIHSGTMENGFRIPKNKVALTLIKDCGGLLTGTSANISGRKSPITAKEAIDQLDEMVDLVIDAGETELKKPSTIIKVLNDGSLIILREGALSISRIISFLRSQGWMK